MRWLRWLLIIAVVVFVIVSRSGERRRARTFEAYNQGMEREAAGEYEQAKAQFEEAVRLDPDFAEAWTFLGAMHFELDDLQSARNCYDKAEKLFIEVGNDTGLAWLLALKSRLSLELGQIDEALLFARQALDISREYDDPRGTSHALSVLADVHIELEQYDEALACCTEALELDRQYGTERDLCALFFAIGRIHQVRGEYADALDALDQILEMDSISASREMRPEDVPAKRYETCVVLNSVAWLLATAADESVRDGERAVRLATEAVEMIERGPAEKDRVRKEWAINLRDTLAAAYAETGDFEKAVATQAEVLAAVKELQSAQGFDMPVSEYEERLELYKNNRPYRE